MAASSAEGASAGQQALAPDSGDPSAGCPRCGGSGWLRQDVPYGHPDFGKTYPCSCLERELEAERLARLRRYSNLGPLTRLSFQNFQPEGRSPDPVLKERFRRAYQAALAFAREPRGWLVIAGASGCGKTHLAAAIANHRLNQGEPAFFMVVPDLLDHLRSTFSPASEVAYDQLFETIRQAPLLVLDALDAATSTPWAREKLFQLLNHRYSAQLPTVVTLHSLTGLEESWRGRLSDPALSQVFPLAEGPLLATGTQDPLALPLLKAMTFEAFDCRGVARSQEEQESLKVAYQAALAFAQEPQGWLVLLGTNGCGKTHLAAAIANYRLAQGDCPIFAVVPDLLDHLRFSFSPESKVTYDQFFDHVRTCPLLILDDLGAHSTTPWAQEKLYQIINYRYNARLPTVITSALSLDELEPRFGSRMMDPTLSLVIPIKAPDYRADRREETPPPRRWGRPKARPSRL